MKQLRLPIFNSKIKIYNLRIVPSDSIYNDVLHLKKQFEYMYGKQPLSGSKPHITLAAFKMNSKYQNDLIQVINQLSQREAFKLMIDGFGVSENSKTLYLKISENKTIETLNQEVRTVLNQNLEKKLKKFLSSDIPHMTISKTRGKKMLYESLQHFQKTKYTREMEIDHLTLVSRSKYKTWDWEHQIKLS